MEKRTIIAFVLSFLVLIGWMWYQSKQQPPVPSDETVSEPQRESVDKTEKPPLPQPSIPEPIDHKVERPVQTQEFEKKISVETPLYRAVFSNRGATIKSFQLLKYRITKDPYAPPIELVNIDNQDRFFEITFNDGFNIDEDIIFDVNRDTILINEGSAPKELHFSHTRADGITLDHIFRFYPDKYGIDLVFTVTNNSGNRIQGNTKAHLRNLPPKEKTSYYAFAGVALFINEKLEQIKNKKFKKEEKNLSGQISWMAYETDYFISSIIPGEETKNANFNGLLSASGVIQATYIDPQISLNPLERKSSEFMLFIGPRDIDILKQTGKKLDKAINYGFFDIIAKPLHYVLLFFNKYVHNYGISIILITIMIKIIFWPLTHKSYKSMKEMQKIQPLMAKIREKYKNNKEQMNRELMGLYKTYKINPMGGCLPMVIQIPVFFALFRILGSSIELRHAPFFLWITDLSAPDRLFHFDLPFKLPLMSEPYGIPVLTLLMGASMFIQQKMTPTPGDPTQAKMMMFLPIIFTFMFINFPSGLVLYWLTNNLLSIGQQYRIKRS